MDATWFLAAVTHYFVMRHQMEIFSALLAICAGNSLVIGEFPAQRPVTRSSDVFFDLRLNERLSKQSWVWWFKTPSRPLWRHSNVAAATFHILAASYHISVVIIISWCSPLNSLPPSNFQTNFCDWWLGHLCETAVRWMWLDLNDKSLI